MNFGRPNEKPATCALCPRFKSGRGFVPGQGAVPAQVMVLLEQPSEYDIQVGTPATGRAAWEINDGLGGTAGREAAFVTYLRKCHVEENDGDAGVEYCAATYLQGEMDVVQPEVVIVVDAPPKEENHAAKLCLGRTDMTVIHGSVFTAEEAAALREVENG